MTSIGTGINDIPQEVADMGYTATPLVTNGNNAPISFGVLSIGTGSVSLNPPGTLLGTANVDVISPGCMPLCGESNFIQMPFVRCGFAL